MSFNSHVWAYEYKILTNRCHFFVFPFGQAFIRKYVFAMDLSKTRFDHTITLQLLTFSIVLLFYILPELEVSWCIPYLQHVLYCFISVVLTFSIEKFNIFEIDLKKKILIKVQIKIQHPWKYQRTNLHLISLKPIFLVFPSVKYTWHVDT